jgi:hypothetical protein
MTLGARLWHVRWSTSIDVSEFGNVRWPRICAESQPRQHGEEPPFDPRGQKPREGVTAW